LFLRIRQNGLGDFSTSEANEELIFVWRNEVIGNSIKFTGDLGVHKVDLMVKESLLTTTEAQIGVKVYPNPVKEELMIEVTLPFDSDKLDIQIFTIDHKKVALYQEGKQSAGRYTFHYNLSSLPDGIYNYQISTDKVSNSGRFTKIE